MKSVIRICVFSLLWFSSHAFSQQAAEFDDFVVHYNAINTAILAPEVAQQYGIRRSSSRAMLNITVMKNSGDGANVAVRAKVTGSARNLTGQNREIEFREISEGDDAVYYIGELTVRNMETFDFMVEVTPEGERDTLPVRFRQQFYTE